MAGTETDAEPDEGWTWLLPGRQGSPAEVMPRIRLICEQTPELFDAMFLLLATHQGLPREILAAATQACRRDIADLSREDITGLYTSILHGGRQGFDAVLRSRRKEKRGSSGLGAWVKE